VALTVVIGRDESCFDFLSGRRSQANQGAEKGAAGIARRAFAKG
jgi:hypothetical protein